MRITHAQQHTFLTLTTLVGIVLVSLFALIRTTDAAPNYQMNYQGKLTNAANVAVADGTYNMRFWLLTTPSIATTSAVWTESLTGTSKVQVTNGLFSVMLGSTSPLTGVDFNQTLYLGVEIGGTSTPAWDGEMSPRKVLGTVPAAFEANKLDGLDSTQFVRTDATSTIATSSVNTLLTLTQSGVGDIFNLFDGTTEVFTMTDGGRMGLGTTSPSRLFTMQGGDFWLGGNMTATGTLTVSGLATFGDFIATNGTTTNATSTNLRVSGLFTLGAGQFTSLLGTGFTNSANVLTCLTANGSTQGCLTGADWTTFMGKVASSSIDSLAEIETLTSVANILIENDIDASSELAALMDDETGSGFLVFSGSPVFTGGATFSGINVTATSTLGYASSTALTVANNAYLNTYTANSGTTTNASSTNLFATNGRFTNATIGSSAGVLTTNSTGLVSASTTIGDSYITDALTLGGGAIGSNNIAGTLTTTGTLTIGDNGDIVNFNTSSWDVTSGAFTGITNLSVTGSSTIGGGTGATGLTINGGATTTGNMYFAGNVGIGSTSPNYKLDVNGTINATTILVNGVPVGTGSGSVSSVDMSVPTGFSISGNPITTSGTLALTYAAGYEGLRSASSTNWNTFYNTPSTRITDGTGLTWSSNTLNCDTANGSTQGCITSTDWQSFNDKVSSSSINSEAELETLTGVDIVTVTASDITSANLISMLTDETGTGNVVFSASPVFTGTAQFNGITASASSTLGYASSTALTVSGNAYINTLNGVATIDSTTETTIESAIDTLANLTAYTATNGTTTNATSTNLAVTNLRVSALRDSANSLGTNGMVLQTNGTVSTWVATSTLGLGSVTSVGLTAPTGFSVGGSPVTTTGTLALSYAAGYEGLLTSASTTLFGFYNTPSTRITDGTGLTWSANTLNCDTANGSTQGCLTGADWTTFMGKVASSSIDSLAEIETLTSVANILIENDIDASSELAALMDDETGSGFLVFSGSPVFTGGATFSGINVTATSTLGYASSTALTVANNAYLNTYTANSGTTTNASSTSFRTVTLGIGSDYITDITGSGLSITNGVLNASGLSNWTDQGAYLTPLTATDGISLSGSSTAQNLTMINSTTTNATTTNLRVSGTSALGTVAAGTWNGTAIGLQYGGMGTDVSGYTNGLFGLNSGTMTDIDTEAELETALGALDVVTVTASDITSANLISMLTDETGTGNVVFSASPVFTGTAQFNGITASASSTLGYASSTALTVSGNAYLNTYTANSGTTTNASSTNLFATNGRFTNATIGSSAGVLTTNSTGLVSASTTIGDAYISDSLTLTTSTGLPISTGVSGLGTNVATFLGTPSSANLAAALTDETGSGSLVFSGSPVFTGGAQFSGIRASASSTLGYASSTALTVSGNTYLGTVSAGTWNGTAIGLQYGGMGTDVSGYTNGLFGLNSGTMTDIDTEAELETALGALDVVTVTASDITSANLISMLTDETGTGNVVFSASPVFTGTAQFNGITASASSTLGYASSTALTVSGNAYINTLNGVATIDSTTETTIESAIDTLANLTAYTATNGTTTNATSTNLFATNGRFTNATIGSSAGVLTTNSTGLVSASTTVGDAYITDALTLSGGTIGSNNISGTLTTTGTLTIGDNGDIVNFNTSSWDVTSGAFTGITNLSVTGSSTIGGGTGATGLTINGTATTTNLKVTGLTPARALFTGADNLFTTTGTSQYLIDSLSDETGTGIAVFGTNPLLSGFRSSASSTIGGGTDTTGLTINGGATTTGVAYFGDYVGVGTPTPYSQLHLYSSVTDTGATIESTWGDSYLDFDSFSGYTWGINNSVSGLFTIRDNTSATNYIALEAGLANSSPTPIYVTDVGNVDIGINMGIATSTPAVQPARLTIDKAGFTGSGVAGIKQYLGFTNSTLSALYYGDETYITNVPTATSTLVGKMIRIADTSALGNTIRGLEVQAHRGTNTKGENTGIAGFGRTFGVRGSTMGDAGSTYLPAGIFAETEGTTQGNALRAYSGTITSENLVYFFQDTSNFTGTGLKMDFGNAGGSFAATSSAKFLDFKVGGTSKFYVAANGSTTIGDGTVSAGLRIPYGGICVDNDGSCVSTTTGQIRSVTSALGNSDLAEMYFSNQSLRTGEIVSLSGGLSVKRASESTEKDIIGVVSTKPGMTLGFDDSSLALGETGFPIGLKGRVPIRLSTENGEIQKGDRIALSSIPGVGMKAKEGDRVVGIALEDYNGTKAYSSGFLNQFGDDMLKERVTVKTVLDPHSQDGCYNGGGNALGENPCVAQMVATTTVINENPEETRAQMLAELRNTAPEQMAAGDGETYAVGQVIMFIELAWYQGDRERMVLSELATTTPLFEGSEVTLWDNIKALASSFVDGVLSVTGLKADRVEVKNELCVDGVCVTADDLRAILQSTRGGNETSGDTGGSNETNSNETGGGEVTGGDSGTGSESGVGDSSGGGDTSAGSTGGAETPVEPAPAPTPEPPVVEEPTPETPAEPETPSEPAPEPQPEPSESPV